MISPFYNIEARASAFQSDRFLELLAAKGLVANQPAEWTTAVVPREGDVFDLGNMQIVCSEVVLLIYPSQSGPVARCYFKVKP